jgi:glyoxylate/hydroxypyruvate reductase
MVAKVRGCLPHHDCSLSLDVQIYVAVSGLGHAQKKRIVDAVTPHTVVFADSATDPSSGHRTVAESAIIFGNVSAGWLIDAPWLRWVQLDSAGVDAYIHVNERRTASTAVVVTHLRDFYDRAVSEAVLGGVLAFYRQLPQLLAAQRDQRWIKREVEPAIGKLHGTRVIILGAGSIGRRIGRLLESFECRIVYFARTSKFAQLRTEGALNDALPTCDLIINTLPHTPATVDLLSSARIALLPATALVVNVGRGSALDETALLAALDSNRLAGAVLDVTREEPLPIDSPLWRHPRVILTQHTAGRFPGETDAKIGVFLENFARYSRQEPLKYQVEFGRGY